MASLIAARMNSVRFRWPAGATWFKALYVGWTSSPDFPVSPGVVQTHLAGAQNVFIAKLDAGGHVVLVTYLGGSGTDTPHAVQIDSAENIYVAGQTTSLDFPTTPGSFQPAPIVPLWNNASPGGFIAGLAANGSALLYSSYVMGLDGPRRGVSALAVTASGEAYLARTTGAGFPVTESAPQICFGGSTDVFVAHLDPRGVLLDATYMGGPGDDVLQGLGLANDGSVLLAWNNTLSRIRFGRPGWSAPACLSPDALNAATLHSEAVATKGGVAPGGVAPGEFITLTGFGIGPKDGVAYRLDAQGQAPRQLAGVQVFFDGQPAPLLYAQSRQVNALAPFELSGKAFTNISAVFNGVTVGPVTVPVVVGSPGIFRLQPGVSSQAAALNQDGTVNGPSNAASRGSVVMLWGTGFGPTGPPCATGGFNVAGPVNLAPGRSAQLQDISPGNLSESIPVLYAGSAPAMLCGVVQINMLVPAQAQTGAFLFFPWAVMSLPDGSAALAADQSFVGVTIAVK
jgi:uncharacterized protein (TIGR03437 family)